MRIVSFVTIRTHLFSLKEWPMSTTLTLPTNCPITDTYRDVEYLIHHICHLFKEKHGGDFDDLLDVANQVFMDVYRGFREGSAPFTSYLSTCVYRRLLDEKRRSMRIKTISISGSGRKNDYEEGRGDIQLEDKSTPTSSPLNDLLDGLSEDAKVIVSLVLETPPEIAKIIEGKGGHPKNVRSTIRQHLTEMGWAYTRIAESFQEIGQVLQCRKQP